MNTRMISAWIGVGLVAYGAWLIYPPAPWIVVGLAAYIDALTDTK